MLVDNQAGQPLSSTRTHETSLAELNGQPLVQRDACGKDVESTGTACAPRVERKRHVARVPRVNSVDARGGRGEPHVHAVCSQIRQRRRCGRTLRQLGSSESLQHAPTFFGRARHFCWSSLEHVIWPPVSADRGKDARDAAIGLPPVEVRLKDERRGGNRTASEWSRRLLRSWVPLPSRVDVHRARVGIRSGQPSETSPRRSGVNCAVQPEGRCRPSVW